MLVKHYILLSLLFILNFQSKDIDNLEKHQKIHELDSQAQKNDKKLSKKQKSKNMKIKQIKTDNINKHKKVKSSKKQKNTNIKILEKVVCNFSKIKQYTMFKFNKNRKSAVCIIILLTILIVKLIVKFTNKKNITKTDCSNYDDNNNQDFTVSGGNDQDRGFESQGRSFNEEAFEKFKNVYSTDPEPENHKSAKMIKKIESLMMKIYKKLKA